MGKFQIALLCIGLGRGALPCGAVKMTTRPGPNYARRRATPTSNRRRQFIRPAGVNTTSGTNAHSARRQRHAPPLGHDCTESNSMLERLLAGSPPSSQGEVKRQTMRMNDRTVSLFSQIACSLSLTHQRDTLLLPIVRDHIRPCHIGHHHTFAAGES